MLLEPVKNEAFSPQDLPLTTQNNSRRSSILSNQTQKPKQNSSPTNSQTPKDQEKKNLNATTTTLEIIESNKSDLLKITHSGKLPDQISEDVEGDEAIADFPETKLEIIEETSSLLKENQSNNVNNINTNSNNRENNNNTKNNQSNQNLVTFTLPSFPSRHNVTNNKKSTNELHNTTSNNKSNRSSSGNSNQQQRKPAFNPLHVILKDKNKYYTTEYI